ncbi:MAG: UDP-N-acetylmuramate--L-alanine ligase [Coriobacteriia bacterium]|jgi:UDP-N-acetylmuramate--alanine ligase|nr:UDP-N-acetylmuramate--L-alanine ligase [Coriobacteriia bacterium]MDR2714430.1 UDP-N-acetylmuramate--L-alanine ligase [Coriobacteriales bacterium]
MQLKETQDVPTPLERVHFIGVSGSGMAGVALIAHKRGIQVSGSDLKESSYVQALLREGVALSFTQNAENVTKANPDLVVVSTAIPQSNPEYRAAQEQNIPVWSRARMLAYLGEDLKTLAVAGTHGKTTTSSLLATSLVRLGADPSFLIGGVVEGLEASAQLGTGPYYVIEADESDGSFVHFNPHVAIVTNVEADHLDHFKSLDEIRASFAAFLDKVTDDGLVIACADCPVLMDLVRASGKPFISYGTSEDANVRFEATDVSGFEITYADGATQTFALGATPGLHNMLNATAVAAALDWLGFDRQATADAIAAFSGVHRRFDRIGEANGVLVVDDYGHHPTEVAATLEAAAGLGYERVHVLFQPHRYTRTQAFMGEFARAFDAASTITLMDIFPAGEAPLPNITSAALMEAIKLHNPAAEICLVAERANIVETLCALAQPGDVVITMGAGDVTALAPQVLAALERA